MSPDEIDVILLSLKVAFWSVLLSAPVALATAHLLARKTFLGKTLFDAFIHLPLVLPPVVIGFYLLVLMGPNGPVGQLTQSLGLGLFPFTFAGLVIGSIFYSLPFVVQPLANAFEALGRAPLEAAATLRASPLDTFFSVVVPLCKPAYITAAVMGFAHTVGEFGIVLMLGGNIPGQTRTVSVQIYDHVEALEYTQAHGLSGGLVLFAFVILLALHALQPKRPA